MSWKFFMGAGILCATINQMIWAGPPAEIPENINPAQREELLQAVIDEEKKVLGETEREIVQQKRKVASLEKRVDYLSRSRTGSTRSRVSLGELEEQWEAAQKHLQELEQKRQQTPDNYEQKRRTILASHPLSGEAKMIQMEGRWLTEEEHQQLLAQQAAEKRQQDLRQTGQQLAGWVWQTLAQQYEFKATKNRVIRISETRFRFVNPKSQQVYSLAPGGKGVEMRFSTNNEHDDSYAFHIEYMNGLGQLQRQHGYVEIGYDSDGRAYLLGVVVPFLDNPLDGTLAATRSSLDNALEKLFSR